MPIIGVNLALPIVAAAGGDAAGAEQEMARFVATGKRVFRSVDEIAAIA